MTLYDFLKGVYGEDSVYLSYSDVVTRTGFSCIFSSEGTEFNKNLDGTTYMTTESCIVEIWHDSLEQVIESSQRLIDAAEGTDFQIVSLRPVREDGYKRKWHRVITIRILEDF